MMKRSFNLFILFGVIMFLLVSVGCNRNDESMLTAPNDSLEKITKQSVSYEDNKLSNRMTTYMANLENENMNFQADSYIQAPSLSWEHSLEVTIEDGIIYINDVLYKKVSSSLTPVLQYSESFLAHAEFLDQANGNQEIFNTLMKLRESKSCYILETDCDSKVGKRIVVYEIDNAYYFLRFFENGKIMRIHRAVIEQEVLK